MGIRNLPGGVPEPDELFGRDHLIGMLWEQLRGCNVLLVAPRRFGKTGVMRHVLKRPRDGYVPVYIEAENLYDPVEFAAELVSALLEHSKLRRLLTGMKRLPGSLANLVSNWVDEIGTDELKITLRKGLAETWEHTAKRLVLEMAKASETVVFIIDELPQFIDNVSRKQGDDAARSFLAWFRTLRMAQKDQLRRFRFLVGGSTSVDMVLRKLNVPDKLNDFFRLPVGELTRQDAEALLGELAESFGLDFAPGATETFFDLIGPPVPYFIHLFVSQILSDPGLKAKPLTGEDLAAVFRQKVLGPACRGYFDPYRQRLKRYGAPGERAAMAILAAVAEAPSGRASDAQVYGVYRKARNKGASEMEYREILADLECDWYLQLDTDTNEYFFLLDLMRAWWRRFYRPAPRKRK